ncbi:MAG: zf-HC2 domain-containing protein [candidate division KSB1 bacterium]|nr:zf-HC2 domain-containing protein [candidate division KSB1 bacterium]MDZ7317909.1 zf-HC2 domain-containing protein [candidate division KSB1 bacterium]MDZ7339883.1 zf-HC2 domain-containing protein [candidate division KSB1 bacterium]
MDSCQRFKELMSDYIEGGLDPQSKQEMEHHFKECLRCASTTEELRSLIQELKALPQVTVSPDFETILRARIRLENGLVRRQQERFFASWKFRVPAFSAAMVVILLAALTVFSQLNRQRQLYPPDAYVNPEYYGGRYQQVDSVNVLFYFLEKQPATRITTQNPIQVSGGAYRQFDRNSAMDSSRSIATRASVIDRRAEIVY